MLMFKYRKLPDADSIIFEYIIHRECVTFLASGTVMAEQCIYFSFTQIFFFYDSLKDYLENTVPLLMTKLSKRDRNKTSNAYFPL